MPALRYACAALLLAVGCEAGKTAPRPLVQSAAFNIHAVSATKIPGSKKATDPSSDKAIFLVTPPIISAEDVTTIQRSVDPNQQLTLSVNLTPIGARQMSNATAQLKGQRIAIVINGEVVAAPKVHKPISASFRISGAEIAKNQEELFEALTTE